MAERGDDGFLSRWSRRKVQVRQGVAVATLPEPAVSPTAPVPVPASAAEAAPAPAAEAAPPAPTLEEAQALTPEADFRRFVTPNVAPDVRNAALKRLFTDPHFNVMDGLDIYIDDYGKPDPIPESMLRLMTQSKSLDLFPEPPPDTLPETPHGASPAPAHTPPAPTEPAATDEDPDLRLQPDDAAGPDGAEPGAGPDPGRTP